MTKKFVTSQLRVGQLIYYILEEKTFGSQKIIQQNAKKLLKTTMSHKYLLLILNVRCTHLAKNDYCFDAAFVGGQMGRHRLASKDGLKLTPMPQLKNLTEKPYRTDFLKSMCVTMF